MLVAVVAEHLAVFCDTPDNRTPEASTLASPCGLRSGQVVTPRAGPLAAAGRISGGHQDGAGINGPGGRPNP